MPSRPVRYVPSGPVAVASVDAPVAALPPAWVPAADGPPLGAALVTALGAALGRAADGVGVPAAHAASSSNAAGPTAIARRVRVRVVVVIRSSTSNTKVVETMMRCARTSSAPQP